MGAAGRARGSCGSPQKQKHEPRVLVAIPAFNEAGTIEGVVTRVRESMPAFDLLVVNDHGSRDATGDILSRLGGTTARHLCNLGYGRSIQTAIKYAITCDYDVLISLDADGQHDPEQVQALYDFEMERMFLSPYRFLLRNDYCSQSPLGRPSCYQTLSDPSERLPVKESMTPSSG